MVFLEGQVQVAFVFLTPAHLSRPRAHLHLSRTVIEYGPFQKRERTSSTQPQLGQSQGTGKNEIHTGTNYPTTQQQGLKGSPSSYSFPSNLFWHHLCGSIAGWPLCRISFCPLRIFFFFLSLLPREEQSPPVWSLGRDS